MKIKFSDRVLNKVIIATNLINSYNDFYGI